MEVVEKDIVHREARERVQHRGDQGGILVFGVAVDVDVARQRGAGKLEDEQRAHQVLHPLRGEGDGQPEKGTAQQVKAVRAHKVGPQVCQVAPPQVAGAHRVVGQPVKGHLLDVEIPVEEEAAAIHQKKGDEHQKGQPQAQEKGLEEIVVPNASLLRFLDRAHKKSAPPEKKVKGPTGPKPEKPGPLRRDVFVMLVWIIPHLRRHAAQAAFQPLGWAGFFPRPVFFGYYTTESRGAKAFFVFSTGREQAVKKGPAKIFPKTGPNYSIIKKTPRQRGKLP